MSFPIRGRARTTPGGWREFAQWNKFSVGNFSQGTVSFPTEIALGLSPIIPNRGFLDLTPDPRGTTYAIAGGVTTLRGIRLVLLVLAVMVASAIAVLSATMATWHDTTRDAVAQMYAASTANQETFSSTTLEQVPPRVARYFRRALREGQPLAVSAQATQEADFFINDAWRPLTATQHFAASPPAFVWDAGIRVAPFVTIHVRDEYVGGRGSMQATMFGVYRFVDQKGVPELNAGALQRYLGEAVWLPTVLLPGHGVTWTAVDDSSAIANLTDGPTSVSLRFLFDADDRIIEVSGDRYAEDKGVYQLKPWRVRCGDHQERSGMLIPLSCEVAWLGPEGPRPYWRGRLTAIEYTFPGME